MKYLFKDGLPDEYPFFCILKDLDYKPSKYFARFIIESPVGLIILTCKNVILYKVSNEVDEMEPPLTAFLYISELVKSEAFDKIKMCGYENSGVNFPEKLFHLYIEGNSVFHVFFVEELEISKTTESCLD